MDLHKALNVICAKKEWHINHQLVQVAHGRTLEVNAFLWSDMGINIDLRLRALSYPDVDKFQLLVRLRALHLLDGSGRAPSWCRGKRSTAIQKWQGLAAESLKLCRKNKISYDLTWLVEQTGKTTSANEDLMKKHDARKRPTLLSEDKLFWVSQDIIRYIVWQPFTINICRKPARGCQLHPNFHPGQTQLGKLMVTLFCPNWFCENLDLA